MKNNNFLRHVISCLALFCSSSLLADVYIHAGQLIDVEAKQTLAKQTIIVDGDRIKSIRSGLIKPASDRDKLIDLSAHTVLPGLMDMHTHLLYEYNPRSNLERFTWNEADFVLRGSVAADKTLQAGFTTVRDLGDAYNASVALRKAINKGWIEGPRIFTAAKSIATTGGHADPTNGWTAKLMGQPGPKQGVVNGVAEARQAVRQRYKDGADLIKITATGGVLSVAKSGQNPQFMTDELEAIVDTAKDYGMTVAVHAHGKEGMRRAIIAGVDSIEHGTYMDDALITLFKKHHTFYVPTISAGNWVAEKSKVPGFFPDIVRPKAAKIGPQIHNTFSKAWRSGVKIAFGTDSGVSPHGENALEFKLMVDAGMPEMEAIISATINCAKLLKQPDLGSIKVGKLADIIAVQDNPLKNIRALENVSFVMKGGKVFKNI